MQHWYQTLSTSANTLTSTKLWCIFSLLFHSFLLELKHNNLEQCAMFSTEIITDVKSCHLFPLMFKAPLWFCATSVWRAQNQCDEACPGLQWPSCPVDHLTGCRKPQLVRSETFLWGMCINYSSCRQYDKWKSLVEGHIISQDMSHVYK